MRSCQQVSVLIFLAQEEFIRSATLFLQVRRRSATVWFLNCLA